MNLVPKYYKLKYIYVHENMIGTTVESVFYDHPWYPNIVAIVDSWSLFRGHLCYKSSKWDLRMGVVIGRWSLFGSEVVVS